MVRFWRSSIESRHPGAAPFGMHFGGFEPILVSEETPLDVGMRAPATTATLARAVRRVERASLAICLMALAVGALATLIWLVQSTPTQTFLFLLGVAFGVQLLAAPLHARAFEVRLVVEAGTLRAARHCRRLGRATAVVAALLVPAVVWAALAAPAPSGPPVFTLAAVGLIALGGAISAVPRLLGARRDWQPALLPPAPDPQPTQTAQGLQAACRRAMVAVLGVGVIALVAPVTTALAGAPAAGPGTLIPIAVATGWFLVVLVALLAQFGRLYIGATTLDHAASWRSRARRLALVHLPPLLAAVGLALHGAWVAGRALAGGATPAVLQYSPVAVVALVASLVIAAAIASVAVPLASLLTRTLLPTGQSARRLFDAVVSALLG